MTFWNPNQPRRTVRRRRSRTRHLRRVAMCSIALASVWLIMSISPAVLGARPNEEVRGTRSGTSPTGKSEGARALSKAWGYTASDEPQDVLVDGATAFLLGSRSLTALDTSNGDEHWRVTLDAPNPWWTVGRDAVIVSTATGFVALERDSGETRWRASANEFAGAVSLLHPRDSTPAALVATQDGGLAALNLKTGTTLWARRLPGRLRGLVVVDDANANIALVTEGATTRVQMIDAQNGVTLWEAEATDRTSTPVFAEDSVVLGMAQDEIGGEVRAYRVSDGKQLWSSPTVGAFQPGLVPVLAGGHIYVVDELGQVMRIDPSTGARVWRRSLGEAVLISRPVIMGKVVVLTDYAREVVIVDRRTGKIRSRWAAGAVPVGVAAAKGLVLVAQRLVRTDQLSAYRTKDLKPT